MYKYLILLAVFAYAVEAQIVICNSEPDCSNINCSVDCQGNSRAVYVGCNCCESCVPTIGRGYSCNYRIETKPGGPTGPNGDPRVTTYNAICAKGLRCDQQTQRCVRN